MQYLLITCIYIVFILLLIERHRVNLMEDSSTSANENRYQTLKDFEYYFNDDGELRHISTNERFEFNVYKNHKDNQMRYEKLGKVVDRYIYKQLEEKCGLQKTYIPTDADDSEAKGFIFHSTDLFTCNKLLLIVHGSGVVRAGQWARRLIINHSLISGSQIPYIKKAQELGYGVIVLNSNQKFDEHDRKITCSKTPEDHFVYVWNEFVLKSAAKHIGIIAHSYGGVITIHGASTIPNLIKRTFAVAFTDSVHYRMYGSANHPEFSSWMKNNVRNWASSSKSLDELLSEDDGDCPTVSAGTNVHEETSWKAFDSVWSFIEKKWDDLVKNTNVDTEGQDSKESVGVVDKENSSGDVEVKSMDVVEPDEDMERKDDGDTTSTVHLHSDL